MMTTKTITTLLAVTMLCHGCTTADRRQAAFDNYNIPPETSEVVLDDTLKRCQQEGVDAGQALNVAGSVLMGVGIFVWPLLIVGGGLVSASMVQSSQANGRCLEQAGYTPKTPPPAEAAIR
jgi:hypothetical protein